MKTCPHCKQPIPVEARECKFCHKAVVRACPQCSQEIYYAARVCRHCNADVNGGPAGAPPPPPPASGPVPPGPLPRQLGPVGDERQILPWVLIAFFVACIGPMIWIWQIGTDINRHGGRARVNPTVDIVLMLVTCGLWCLFVFWKYAEAWNELVVEEGGEARTDLPLICLLVGFFMPPAALAMMQHEMNEHWKRHPSFARIPDQGTV